MGVWVLVYVSGRVWVSKWCQRVRVKVVGNERVWVQEQDRQREAQLPSIGCLSSIVSLFLRDSRLVGPKGWRRVLRVLRPSQLCVCLEARPSACLGRGPQRPQALWRAGNDASSCAS